jgi:predicted dehydrogenase
MAGMLTSRMPAFPVDPALSGLVAAAISRPWMTMRARGTMVRRLSRRETLASVAAGIIASGAAPGRSGSQSEILIPEVRVGLIGLEGHTAEIFDVARKLPQVRITGVADPDDQQLARVKQNRLLASAKTFSDHRAMLDSAKLDVVAVCGSNAGRARIIQECATRKIAVVAEKPLALDLAELGETRKVVEASGIPFSILLPMRFEPHYRRMRAVVESGRIGEVVALAAQKSYKLGERPDWMKSRRTFGGTIPYIGIHMVDLMRWVGGREFVSAAAFQSNVGAPQAGEMENNVAMIFTLDNRGTGSLRMDYLRPAAAPTHGDDRLRIAGTKGVVEYQQSTGVTLVTDASAPVTLTDLPAPRALFMDFLESMHGGRMHAISRDDCFRVNEIVLRARDAAERGRIEPL